VAEPEGHLFLFDLGYAYRVDGGVCLSDITVGDELRAPGSRLMRTSILATLSDVVGGALANRAIAGRVPLTVDLAVHCLAPVEVTELTMAGRVIKPGRSTVVTETWFSERGEERPLALSHATFVASPNPADVIEVYGDAFSTQRRLDRPLPDQLGIRRLQPGVAELDRSAYVTQNSGTIQGGALALLAEVAAESLVAAPLAGLEIRYLSAVRAGPARATAEVLGAGVVRVEVRDRGNEGRLAALVLFRT